MRPDENYQIKLIDQAEAEERLWDDDDEQQRSQRVSHGMEVDDSVERGAFEFRYRIDPHATA